MYIHTPKNHTLYIYSILSTYVRIMHVYNLGISLMERCRGARCSEAHGSDALPFFDYHSKPWYPRYPKIAG